MVGTRRFVERPNQQQERTNALPRRQEASRRDDSCSYRNGIYSATFSEGKKRRNSTQEAKKEPSQHSDHNTKYIPPKLIKRDANLGFVTGVRNDVMFIHSRDQLFDVGVLMTK
jgi:hypothetical protein